MASVSKNSAKNLTWSAEQLAINFSQFIGVLDTQSQLSENSVLEYPSDNSAAWEQDGVRILYVGSEAFLKTQSMTTFLSALELPGTALCCVGEEAQFHSLKIPQQLPS